MPFSTYSQSLFILEFSPTELLYLISRRAWWQVDKEREKAKKDSLKNHQLANKRSLVEAQGGRTQQTERIGASQANYELNRWKVKESYLNC